jgi:hypothetical protein
MPRDAPLGINQRAPSVPPLSGCGELSSPRPSWLLHLACCDSDAERVTTEQSDQDSLNIQDPECLAS